MGPYAELRFDAEGDVDPAGRAAVARLNATDLLVFSHGWNSERSTATRLYDRFFAPFPGLVGPSVRLGYVGVVWPSIRFADEPIPDFDLRGIGGAGEGPGLDAETRRALGEFWPGHEAELDRIAELLSQQPESAAAITEFGVLVRALAGLDGMDSEEPVPALFAGDAVDSCRALGHGLAEAGREEGPGALWDGGRELLRQATYHRMKKRAGVVGERGLGPVLTDLARGRPELRVHLIGHSFGARVVAFALRAVPDGWDFIRSLILLQGAFSHYAFADRLPHDQGRGGALAGLQRRVRGPVVSCYSRHDSALKVFYPLASRMAGDSAGFAGFDARWGAMGHDGVQAVPGAARITLDTALRGGLPEAGCVSVDAAAVVRRGGAPSGAHSDICHEELARVVVAAGRMGR
ncbi:serine-threonine protein kinase [Streptomyces venezuelae]|uniref:Serine-threonine protein kinase n=1 Tax=Streptomyces venezuelae TaxID=54571 RepID=A0A5P2DD49_STRVZ|nr:serine-threonine protein kinase [Streptomyces venezuelae]